MSALTESKHWRYMDGMLDVAGFRLVARARGTTPAGKPRWHGLADGVHMRYHAPGEPNIDDPATQGCVEALAQDAWSDPFLFLHGSRLMRMWSVVAWDGRLCHKFTGPTKGEALSAAILAAP